MKEINDVILNSNYLKEGSTHFWFPKFFTERCLEDASELEDEDDFDDAFDSDFFGNEAPDFSDIPQEISTLGDMVLYPPSAKIRREHRVDGTRQSNARSDSGHGAGCSCGLCQCASQQSRSPLGARVHSRTPAGLVRGH